MNTFEFEITIQRKYEDSCPVVWPVVVTIRQPGDGLRNHAEEDFHLSDEQFCELDKLKLKLQPHQEYGTLLGKALFHGEVLRCFDRTFANSNERGDSFRLLLSVAANDDKLRTLHWEWLCAPIDNKWKLLSRTHRIIFSQYIPTLIDRRFPSFGRRSLRVLILVASPSNLGQDYELANFNVEQTISDLKKVLGDIDIDYDVLAHDVEGAVGQPTLNELVKQLTNAQKPYTLLHIVCHGLWKDEDKDTALYWTTADNQVHIVTGAQLTNRLGDIAQGLPHFTFFCACESAVPTTNGKVKAEFGGLAQRLVRELGMPAVVGMTREVSIETALKLAENFYQRLREHGEVDKALREAITPLADQDDITVPALFSRLGGRPLFSDRLEGRELTNEEIDDGIDKLRKQLHERAPKATVLNERFNNQVETLTNIKGAESNEAREKRRRALYELNNICDQLLDGISFDALAALDQKPPEYKAKCPFPGLSSFRDEEYHEFFFGRDGLIKELQNELEKDNFLAVIGPSGSGKSSVVLAGLIPKLCKEKSLKMEYLTPTDKPLQQLQTSLSAVSNQTAVFVVDQFEELFTLCSKKRDQKKFIKELLELAENQKVIITMRADFMGEYISIDSKLKKRIPRREIFVAPMEPHELGIAMKLQAEKAELKFEDGLSNAVLAEVEEEPGAMPLLQYALRELWERRQGKWLRSEEYEEIGGLKEAIAKTADTFYAKLNEEEQYHFKNIFLRLTQFDLSTDGGKPRYLRKRVKLDDLVTMPRDSTKGSEYHRAVVKDLVTRLAGAEARLVVTSVGDGKDKDEIVIVEVAHEALLRHWDKLKGWLEDHSQDKQLCDALEKEANAWQSNGEKQENLVREGSRLEDAIALLENKKELLSEREIKYIEACLEKRDRQEQEKLEASLDVSISSSQLLFASNKKLDALVDLIKTGKIWRNELEKYESSRLRFLVMLGYVFSELAEYNSINAYEDDQVTSVTWSPDNQIVASASSRGEIKIWSADGTFIEKIPQAHNKEILNLTFSPDEEILASGGTDGNIKLWRKKVTNTEAKNEKKTTFSLCKEFQGHTSKVNCISFSPKGELIASASGDNTVKLWKQEKGDLLQNLDSHKSSVTCVAFSPNGKMLASADASGAVKLWSCDNVVVEPLKSIDKGHSDVVKSVDFSKDGKILVSSGWDKLIKLWNTAGESVNQLDEKTVDTFNKQEREVLYVNFSPDGKLLASTDMNGTIKLWVKHDNNWSKKGKLFRTLKHEKAVLKVNFSQDGKKLLSCSEDKTIKFWNCLSKFDGYVNGEFKGHSKPICSIDFARVGKTIATASKDGTVKVWDRNGELLQTLIVHEGERHGVEEVRFSQDGKIIATVSDDETVKFWRSDNWRLGYEKHESIPTCKAVRSVSFSPVDNIYATVCKDRFIKILDLNGKAPPSMLELDKKVKKVTFNPDGTIIASLTEDGTVKFWKLDNSKPSQIFDITKGGKVYDVSFITNDRIVTVNTVSNSQSSEMKLWSIDSQCECVNRITSNTKQYILDLKFIKNSKTVISIAADYIIEFWNLDNLDNNYLKPIKLRSGIVSTASFSPDWSAIAVADSEIDYQNRIKLWNLNLEEALKEADSYILDYQRAVPI